MLLLLLLLLRHLLLLRIHAAPPSHEHPTHPRLHAWLHCHLGHLVHHSLHAALHARLHGGLHSRIGLHAYAVDVARIHSHATCIARLHSRGRIGRLGRVGRHRHTTVHHRIHAAVHAALHSTCHSAVDVAILWVGGVGLRLLWVLGMLGMLRMLRVLLVLGVGWSGWPARALPTLAGGGCACRVAVGCVVLGVARVVAVGSTSCRRVGVDGGSMTCSILDRGCFTGGLLLPPFRAALVRIRSMTRQHEMM